MSLQHKLRALVDIVLDEAEHNPAFAEKLTVLLGEARTTERVARKRTGRRTPAILDPFAIMQEHGELSLREALCKLDLEQLRDIIAEHQMDSSKLAMKWKAADRVIDLVVSTAARRLAKGDMFRDNVKSNTTTPAQSSGADITPAQSSGTDTTPAQSSGADITPAQSSGTDTTPAHSSGTDTTPA